MLGEYDEGRAAAEEGLTWTRDNKQGYLEAELLRSQGALAYRGGDIGSATATLQRAVEVARAQGAGWLEQRALRSQATCFPS